MSRGLDDVPNLGAQWDEGRGFDRVFTQDPVKQERLIKLLISLIRHYEMGPRSQEKAATIASLNALVMDLTIQFPDFLSAQETEDGFYRPDEHLLHIIHSILSGEGA